MKIIFLTILLIGIFMEKADAEQMYQAHSSHELSIDGGVMSALKIACDKFMESGNDMRGFNVTISRGVINQADNDADIFAVTFIGKLLPGKKRGLGTANRTPGSVTYFISKKELKIIKEQGIR